MEKLPIITRLVEPPKVGRWYRVPAIRIDRTHGNDPFFIPHRNFPLSQMHHDEGSIITCPLHGLRIHSETEIVA
jgi:hypothetical protein